MNPSPAAVCWNVQDSWKDALKAASKEQGRRQHPSEGDRERHGNAGGAINDDIDEDSEV